jgi:hypothetical protein
MAALDTRAEIAKNKDYYLTVLPRTADNPEWIDTWIEEPLAGKYPVMPFYQQDKKKSVLFARGCELVRTCEAQVGNEPLEWEERVQLVRTEALYVHHGNQLERPLQEATEQVRGLTPPVGRGQRQ